MKAAWPKFADEDDSAELWLRQLRVLDADVAEFAIKRLVETLKRPPAVADFQEACRDAQHHVDERPERRPCTLCDDGWLEEPDPLYAHQPDLKKVVLRKCPNGCLPITRVQRQAIERRETEDFMRRRQNAVQAGDAAF